MPAETAKIQERHFLRHTRKALAYFPPIIAHSHHLALVRPIGEECWTTEADTEFFGAPACL
jgi:hypothetical protein